MAELGAAKVSIGDIRNKEKRSEAKKSSKEKTAFDLVLLTDFPTQ